VNDVVYQDVNLTTVFNGNSQWFKTSWGGDLYSIQIDSSGVILSVTTCSTCPSQTPTPTTTVTSTPTNTPTVTPTPTTPEASYTPTPTVTPTPQPSEFYIKGTNCADALDIRFFSYTDGPLNDGNVIQINSGINIGCWTLSTFMPGTGENGDITGTWSIIANCGSCTI
jgi:hypothetical protein